MGTRVFSPDEWSFNFAGLQISSGKGSDAWLTLEQMEEGYSVKAGIDGEVTVIRNKNRTWVVTVTLQQSSAENDKLSAAYIAAELIGVGAAIAPIAVKDGNGTSLLISAESVCAGMPKTDVGKDLGVRAWKFYAINPKVFVGGNSSV